ncbi:MAG TPA: hypothetical protein VF183_05645, partial [Acidimicrobiales bacterium]
NLAMTGTALPAGATWTMSSGTLAPPLPVSQATAFDADFVAYTQGESRDLVFDDSRVPLIDGTPALNILGAAIAPREGWVWVINEFIFRADDHRHALRLELIARSGHQRRIMLAPTFSGASQADPDRARRLVNEIRVSSDWQLSIAIEREKGADFYGAGVVLRGYFTAGIA